MNALTLLISLGAAAVLVQAKPGTVCVDQSQCDQGECCQILSEFMVVSKRQAKLQTLLPFTKPAKTGTCQSYSTEGSHCNSFDKMNGYCSCGPALSCQSRKDPNWLGWQTLPTAVLMTMPPQPMPTAVMMTAQPVSKRQQSRMMRPGYISTCEKITTPTA